MLNLKLLLSLALLLSSAVAVFTAWNHQQARAVAIKQSLSVEPGTAARLAQFKDR